MNKPTVAALYNLPRADDENAGPKIKDILFQHVLFDPVENRQITAVLETETFGLTSPNEGIVACFGLLPKSANSFAPECATTWEFLSNDTCVVNCHDGQPIVYDSWLKGYARLVHDVWEFWKQREVDARLVTGEYELLRHRLPVS